MDSKAHVTLKSKLQTQESSIQGRLAELELELSSQKETAEKEIDKYLQKQKEILSTIEFLDKLQEVEEETELRFEHLKKEEKARTRKYQMTRKSNIESRIMDYKQGAVRTQGTSLQASYLENIHYYQNQLNSLMSDLPS